MSKLIDLTNQRFGFWIVKKRGENTKNGQVQWICVCECNREKLVTSNSLRTSNSTSCGCNHAPNLINKKFGKLKVLKLKINENKTRRYWICQCKCGTKIEVSTHKLREKLITSCNDCENTIKNNTIVDSNTKFIKLGVTLLEINEALQQSTEFLSQMAIGNLLKLFIQSLAAN